MPHNFSFYEDYESNKERLNIRKAASNLKQPFLIIHGEIDKAVDKTEAENLHQWNSESELKYIKNCGHTFGSKHPWTEKELPSELDEVLKLSLDFIKTNL